MSCIRCKVTKADELCCSSHNALLCHRCYRRTHFVEICGTPDGQGGRNCEKCAAEGLDPATQAPATPPQ